MFRVGRFVVPLLASAIVGVAPLTVHSPLPVAAAPTPAPTDPSPGPSPTGEGTAPSAPPGCPSANDPAVLDEVDRLRRSTIGVRYEQARVLVEASRYGRTVQVGYVGASGAVSAEPRLPAGAEPALVVVVASSTRLACRPEFRAALRLTIVLMLGAVMPEVVGTDRAAAMRELGRRGLDRHVSWRPTTADERRVVRAQDPMPGALVAFTDPVRLDFGPGAGTPASSPAGPAGATRTAGAAPPAGDTAPTTTAAALGFAGVSLLLLVLLALAALLVIRRRGLRARWVAQHVRLAPGSGGDWTSGSIQPGPPQARPDGHAIRLDPHADPGTSSIRG